MLFCFRPGDLPSSIRSDDGLGTVERTNSSDAKCMFLLDLSICIDNLPFIVFIIFEMAARLVGLLCCDVLIHSFIFPERLHFHQFCLW